MSRRVTPVLALILSTLFAAPALAQGSGGSVFKMFIAPIPPNADFLDWIGVIQIWVIILLSFLAVSLIISFWMKSKADIINPPETREQIEAMMNEKRYKDAVEFANADPSFLGKVVAGALNEAGNGYSAMERAIDEVADAEVTKMLRPVEYLSIVGNVAPMLGLFGTVYGMIVAFQRLVDAGGKPDPAMLAGGISTALVTTFWGLVVAMPAITAYAFIRNRYDEATTAAIVTAEDLIKSLKPGAKKPASAPSSASATPKPRAEQTA